MTPSHGSSRPEQASIFVALPNYKGASGACIVSLLKLQAALGARKTVLWPWLIENESNIDRARGKALAAFLKTSASHLLFLDTDIGIDAQDLLRMIDADKPIIGGAIAMKQIDFDTVVEVARAYPTLTPKHCVAAGTTFAFAGDASTFDDLNKPQRVQRVGTGCMLIRRDVVERLWAEHGAELSCTHQGVYFVNLFQCMIDRLSGQQIGTDYSFCDRARDAGFETWLAPWTCTTHRGEYTFRASLMDMADSE